MKLTTASLIICFGIVLFAACKKNDDTNNNNNNNNNSVTKQRLINGKWQMKASIATLNYMGKDTTVDIYAGMDHCEKDNFILFADNGTITVDDNTEKCPGQPQTAGGTWQLLENDTKLYIVDNNPDTMDLVEVTDLQFIMKKKSNFSGTIGTSTYTFRNIK